MQAALDAIHGVDLNPFAVAIARFRLTVAALKACGLTSLENAPAFNFHLAVGDSLIHGPDPDVLPGMADRSAYMPFTYETEDGPLLLSMLEEGTLRRRRRQPALHHRQGQGPQPDLPLQVRRRLQGQLCAHCPIHGAVLRLGQEWRAGRLGRTDHQQLVYEARVRHEADRGLSCPTRICVWSLDTSGPTSLATARQQSSSLAGISRTGRARPFVRSSACVVSPAARRSSEGHCLEHRLLSTLMTLAGTMSWITVTDLERQLLARHPWSSWRRRRGRLSTRQP